MGMIRRLIVPAAAACLLAGICGSSAADDPAGDPDVRAEVVAVDLWLDGVPPIHVDAQAMRSLGRRELILDRPSLTVGSALALSAAEGVAQLEEGAVRAEGEVAATVEAAEPVEIRAERFRVDVAAGTGTFDGSVEVTQGTLALVCDHLEVSYDRGVDEIRSVVASGRVEIRQGTRVGRGERAEFDRAQGLVELSGSPYLEEGGVRLQGQSIRFRVDGGEIDCTACRAVFGAGP